MTGSAVLGTAIGLALVFGLLALFASAVTETISSFTQRRARYLLTGLRSMLDQEESTGSDKGDKSAMVKTVKDLAATQAVRSRMIADPSAAKPGDLTIALFGHPLIRAQQTRRVTMFLRGSVRNPSYLAASVFSRALIDTLVPATTADGAPTPAEITLTQIQSAAEKLPTAFPARGTLLMLAKQAAGDMTKFEASLCDWYDQQMTRISGWYKRWAKVVLVVIGVIVAVTLNVDALGVGRELYVDGPVREAVVSQALNGSLCQDQSNGTVAKDCADAQIKSLGTEGLPIGYSHACVYPLRSAACWITNTTDSHHTNLLWTDVLLKLLGWIVAGFATSFGAPFWFDALSKLGNLRTAAKPATSS